MRVLSLDQSSHCSGWAFFDNGKLVESGTFTFNDSHFPERLVKIRNKVEELIDLYCPEVVVLEDIQLQTQTNNVTTYKALAEVIGVLEELCQELRIPHELILAASWKSQLGIKGRTRPEQKKNAQAYVTKHYSKEVSQDESDAICIGTCYVQKNESAF